MTLRGLAIWLRLACAAAWRPFLGRDDPTVRSMVAEYLDGGPSLYAPPT